MTHNAIYAAPVKAMNAVAVLGVTAITKWLLTGISKIFIALLVKSATKTQSGDEVSIIFSPLRRSELHKTAWVFQKSCLKHQNGKRCGLFMPSDGEISEDLAAKPRPASHRLRTWWAGHFSCSHVGQSSILSTTILNFCARHGTDYFAFRWLMCCDVELSWPPKCTRWFLIGAKCGYTVTTVTRVLKMMWMPWLSNMNAVLPQFYFQQDDYNK